MSTELNDHAEQLAQFEAAEYWRKYLEDLEDYYKPLRPVAKTYYSDLVEEGKVSPQAELVTAQLTQEIK